MDDKSSRLGSTEQTQDERFYAAGTSVAASAVGKNFDAAPALAPAPAPTLLYSKAKFRKLTKVHVETTVSCSYDSVRFIVLYIAENMN
jgi:hypothetical protein